jgi:hypothetical protein
LEGKISKLPLDKDSKLKEGSWRCTKEKKKYLVFGGKKKEENESVRKGLVFYVWNNVVHEKNVCKQEHGRELCVAST